MRILTGCATVQGSMVRIAPRNRAARAGQDKRLAAALRDVAHPRGQGLSSALRRVGRLPRRARGIVREFDADRSRSTTAS
jgi:hypothetical protein